MPSCRWCAMQHMHGLANSQTDVKQSGHASRVSQVADIHIPVSTRVQHVTRTAPGRTSCLSPSKERTTDHFLFSSRNDLMNERRTYRQHHESQCECFPRVLQATPHIVGLIPNVLEPELTGCQISKQQQPLLSSLAPRKLRSDGHNVLCARARLVGAQHVHSSLTSWTFARAVLNSLNRSTHGTRFLEFMFKHSPLR